MNNQQDSKSQEFNGGKRNVNRGEQASLEQLRIVNEFFKRDGAAEMIESVHTMIEDFLFTENLAVTPEMRVHIVNNLRIATFIARLERSRW